MEEMKLRAKDRLADGATKKLKNADLRMSSMGGVRLRLELDKVPLWRGNHVSIKQRPEDFPGYLYLPRLRDDA